MSEFKFACPVCGQHITADSSTSGGQLECPTCFQKILVPQAPAAQDTKFILSATQVGKPRPTSEAAAAQLGPMQPAPRRSSIPAVIALLVLLCGAGAALYVYRDRIFKSASAPVPVATNAPAPPPAAVPVVLNTNYPVPTNFTWTLDLTNAVIPEATVAGRVHGSGFFCEKAVVRGGVLTLSQGKPSSWDLAVTVGLYAHQGEELSGKSVEIAPERPRSPRVSVRWRDEQHKLRTENFNHGYSLIVSFGQATNARMTGKIYLCVPDPDKSFVAGTFDAEIKRAPPPKPRPPKPPPLPKP